jgi:hypothetical protein
VYALNQSYYARIFDTDLDFKVMPTGLSPEVKRGPFYQVDVALRFMKRQVHGNELKLQLLDRFYAPLTRVTHNLDFVMLPSFSWSGTTSIFKSDQFEQASEPPRYLLITLYDDDALFPLLQDRPGGGDTVGPIDTPVNPASPGTTPPGAPAPGGAPPPAPAPKCCPNLFVTPNGAQPTTVTNVLNAAGVPTGANVSCQPWVIQATFNAAPPPCQCNCCRYRQRVRGTMTMTPPGGGAPCDISPVTDYVPAPGPVAPGAGPLLAPVHGLNAANFVEDTVGDPNQPGNPLDYGRRNNIAPRPGGKWVPQDYPNACTYWGMDWPGNLASVPKGATLAINVTFEGAILDTCNADAVVKGPNLWTWTFNGVA